MNGQNTKNSLSLHTNEELILIKIFHQFKDSIAQASLIFFIYLSIVKQSHSISCLLNVFNLSGSCENKQIMLIQIHDRFNI